MRSGLYGKLPAKRDFIAEALPEGFLAVWEPWLQDGLVASRAELGTHWPATWMAAPIWRFWLGPAVCGRALVGVMMPSVDGVGRCYPLTAVASAADGAALPAPADCAADPWFAAIEDLLLSALDDGRTWDGLLADLDGLAGPATIPIETAPESPHVSAQSASEETRLATSLAPLAETTRWWTIGGPTLPAATATFRGLPDAALFGRLLTGRLDD